MMDVTKNLILIKGQSRTSSIDSCRYLGDGYRVAVVFKGSPKTYTYRRSDVTWMVEPIVLNPAHFRIRRNGVRCDNIVSLLLFTTSYHKYYHIEYASGTKIDCSGEELEILASCLSDEKAMDVFQYLKDVADINNLQTDDGQNLLATQYEGIDFIPEHLALAPYINPEKYGVRKSTCGQLIFPFGCNNSQFLAVQRAFESQISVIQGPPGTGKTQTILNIIANILMRGCTVLVVSNNNSAIENVQEKLAKYDLDFVVATLGKAENKQKFIEQQQEGHKFPQTLCTWKKEYVQTPKFNKDIDDAIASVKEIFKKQERLAVCRQMLADLEIEWTHYKKHFGDDGYNMNLSASSAAQLKFLNAFMEHVGIDNSPSWWKQLKWWFKKCVFRYKYKVDKNLFEEEPSLVVKRLQNSYYAKKQEELNQEIEAMKSFLENKSISTILQRITELSMDALKNKLYHKYICDYEPVVISEDSLRYDAINVLKEFPVVLSTTFSARSSLYKAEYDYVIMDEASQVAVETGVLALSCAKNAIIVGDTMQLPNVVTSSDAQKLNAIFGLHNISKGYDSASNSFLQSVLNIQKDIPRTLLKEHYRCAPRIINYCNQKFYKGELVIMTHESESKNSIQAIRTVKGNHSRGHINQREIDVICKEVLPSIEDAREEIGIISPYNKQVDAIANSVDERVEVATVHKFQGREKNTIVISVVDDQISTFADDPNLLNVAISRAKKKLFLVVSGNEQDRTGNITDLLDYIQYNNGSVVNSRIRSVFDFLYKQYAGARAEYLKRQKRISEYDSENLAYQLISDILSENPKLNCLDVLCHYPLNLLIRDTALLSDCEKEYISHTATHVDFLIYNRVSKKPLLAIEVDGWTYHQKGTKQYERDRMKDHIMSQYDVDFLRLSTVGSGEREVIEEHLKGKII